MSADWIKMRCDLQTHPKIVRILSATCPQSVHDVSVMHSEKLRIVGALHAVWCLFDMHTIDGILRGYTLDMMDNVIGFPGLAQAMVDVGWLAADAETLVMPEFDAHNGKGAKRRAEDAKRKKIDRSERPQNVRKMSEKNRTDCGLEKEKEKEKELTTTSKTKDARTALPARAGIDFRALLAGKGIPEGLASDWLAMRKEQKAPVTETALRGIEREAAKAGLTLAEALTMSCERSWRGFKAEWIAGDRPPNGTHRNGTDRDAGRRAAARAIFGNPESAQNDTNIIDITPAAPRPVGR